MVVVVDTCVNPFSFKHPFAHQGNPSTSVESYASFSAQYTSDWSRLLVIMQKLLDFRFHVTTAARAPFAKGIFS